MESSQKSIRVMHYIGEFLDLDAKSFTNIAEFIALIQAIREGLSRIDPTFAVSDFHINVLFLSKLQAHPKWNEWARHMLRDPRVNVLDSSKTMAFRELAELAIQHEKYLTEMTRIKQARNSDDAANGYYTGRLQNYTQEEINSFVIRQMRNNSEQQQQQQQTHNHKRHSKRPSQEEINEFVVRQMREEQERKTRARSKSEPRPNLPSTTMVAANRTTKSADNDSHLHITIKCDICGERTYPGQKCHHMKQKDMKKLPTVQIPRGNFVPKKVEFVKRTADGLPVYRTGFALT